MLSACKISETCLTLPVESLIDDDLRHTYKARARMKWAERIRQLTGM